VERIPGPPVPTGPLTAVPAPSRVLWLCDAATIALLGAAVVLLLAGPYRNVVAGSVVTLRWTHAAFAAAALAAIRHVARPAPSLAHGVKSWTAAVAGRPALADAAVAFCATRPAVLMIGLLAVSTIGFAPAAGNAVGGRHTVRELPARFDANWYAGIALEGYDWQYRFDRQQNLAFFPAFPMLMRAAGALTGAFRTGLSTEMRITHLLWTGLLLSLSAFFVAAWYFARLAGELLPGERARAAVLLLASYPFAVFYSAAYTESLFLLTSVAAWFHMRRGQLVPAAACALVAGLSRPNGFLLSVPLVLIALGPHGAGTFASTHDRGKRVVVATMPTLGMLLFTLYLYQRTGIWFVWMRMHGAWGRLFGDEIAGQFAVSLSSDGLLQLINTQPFDTLNAIGLAFALALVWPVGRHIGVPWAAYVVVNLMPPLLAGGLLSIGRITSTLFPVFLALAAVLPSRLTGGVLALFGLLQGLIAALFFTWRNVY
jgi:hypothetical protein